MVSGGGSGVWSGALNGVPSGKIPDASFGIQFTDVQRFAINIVVFRIPRKRGQRRAAVDNAHDVFE